MNKLNIVLKCSFVVILVFMLSVSCHANLDENVETSKEVGWSKSIARHVTDDGWVYTCEYFCKKDGTIDETIPSIVFNVMNLRYTKENMIQIMGEGVDEETDRDMLKISRFLGYGENVMTFPALDEILSKKRDLVLEEIDVEIFYSLLDQAVAGSLRPVGKYFSYPLYALLSEQTYLEGYRIQIGFRQDMGILDVVMIDVLYKDDENSTGYVHLYDIVKKGMASEEQILLYDLISEIENGITSNNDLTYGKDIFSTKKIGEFDFSRLYTMLVDIEEKDYMKYALVSPMN